MYLHTSLRNLEAEKYLEEIVNLKDNNENLVTDRKIVNIVEQFYSKLFSSQSVEPAQSIRDTRAPPTKNIDDDNLFPDLDSEV